MRKFTVIFFLSCLTIYATGGMNILGQQEISEIFGVVSGITGNILEISGDEDIVLNIERTPMYDLLTGLPIEPSFIEIGMNLRVAYTEHTALTVWVNPDTPYSAVFSVIASENIQFGHDFCEFLCTVGKYRIVLSPNAEIIDPLHGAISPLDISPGQEFFIWVDMITASHPALVYPDKVVLIYD